MSKLYFKIASDWEEVVKLRNEIAKLKQELKGMDSTQSPAAFKTLNTQLAASTQRMDELVTNAAKAGAEMETGFKRKIFDASQVVNSLSEKIMFQRGTIQQLKNELSGLKDKYREALKQDGDTSSLEAKIRSTNEKLKEQKSALFNLTQEQANARLSVKKLRDEYELYNNDGKKVIETNNGMAISWKKALAVVGGAAALKQLGSEIIRVRGEFQSMQTAMETMVGKDVAGPLMAQVKELAKISPLTMTDMVGAEKMMLGFNIQAEDTIKYLKALSDISMGESDKFNSLTLAFSQMSAAGKLMGQDMNQMINAGFNPLQTISEKTGKSIATLKDEMSKGAISAEMVQQAFLDATSAGGKLYNMSENASKTINGQLSMMQDALDNVFNELGTKGEGVIMSGIQATTSLIQNYETVGKVLAGLVVTYGTYRTAVMLVTAAESKHTLVEIGLTNARILARKAQLALNAAMLTNPYVLLAVAVGGLATAMWVMSDSTTAAARAQKEYNDIKDAASKKEQEHKQKIEELLTAACDESLATLTRQKSLEELRKEYPKIFEQYDIEKLKLADILKLKQQINEEDSKRSVQGRKDDYKSLKQIVSNQQRYLQLFDNPELRKNMSDADMQIWKMFASKQSYVQVREQMEKNSKLLKKYQKDVLDDNIASYKANLKNYSKEKLEVELKMAQSSASKRNGFNVGGMMVKGGDLESIISSINGALAEKKSPNTYKQDYEEAKKDWEDAKKKLSEIEKDKSKFTSKQYEEAKKRKDAAEKAYKDLGGVTGSSLTKQENQAKKEAKKQLKQQEQLAEQLLSLRRKNGQDEINLMEDNADKKLKQIKFDFEFQKQAIEKNAKELSKANKNAGITGLNANGLTTEQQAEIDKANKLNSDNRAKAENDVYKSEVGAMRDYLKEYGTFQQQKLAIAEEYAEKIKNAQNEGERLSLEKQRDVAIQNKETEAIKANIDWVTVFGEFGSMFSDMVKPALDEAKKYVRTDKFKNSDQASQKSLIDAIGQMEKSLGGASGVNFKKLGQDVKAYQTAEQNRTIAVENEGKALEKLKKAQEDYTKAQKDGTKEEKKAAADALGIAQQNADIASANVKTQTDIANQSQQEVADTATKLKASMENLVGGLQQMSSGGLYNAYSGIIKTVNGFKDVIGKTSESLKEVPIVGWILSIIDVLKDGLSNLIGGLLDAVFNAVSGIIEDVFSGDLLFTIVKSIGNGLMNVGKALGEGLSFGLLDLGGADYSSYNKMKEEYGALIDVWDTLISKKQQYIDISYGDEARKAGQEALNLLNKKAQSNATLGIERLNSGASAGSHSIGVRQRKGMSKQGWDELRKAAQSIGFDYNSVADGRMTGLFDLTAEQLSKLQDEAPTFWAKLDGDVQEYLQNIIDCNTEIENMKDRLNETMTGVSFDSFYDSFVSTLSDMDKSSKDMADDFGEYLKSAILSNLVANKYRTKIEALYNDWANKSDSDGDGIFDLTAEESAQLKAAQQALAEEIIAERDAMADTFGWTGNASSQSATNGGFQTMSQDTGSELNGRFTAFQMSNEEIKNQSESQSQSLNLLTAKADAILSVNTEVRNIADDTRNLIANAYLELVQISENTGAIVKPIQQMQKDIAEVKNNTKGLSSK